MWGRRLPSEPPAPKSAGDGLRSRDFRLDRAVRTARLLHTRVCAPNGIRTRVSALKGRHPRPLDDGGRVPLGTAAKVYRRACAPILGTAGAFPALQ